MRAEENGNSECRSEGINVLEKKSTNRLITRLNQNWSPLVKFQHYFGVRIKLSDHAWKGVENANF